MSKNNFKIGDKVTFHKKVYKYPYAPYFKKYINHVFEIISFHDNNTVKLNCLSDNTILVDGYVFIDCIIPKIEQLKLLSNCVTDDEGIRQTYNNIKEYCDVSYEQFKTMYSKLIITKIDKLLDF